MSGLDGRGKKKDEKNGGDKDGKERTNTVGRMRVRGFRDTQRQMNKRWEKMKKENDRWANRRKGRKNIVMLGGGRTGPTGRNGGQKEEKDAKWRYDSEHNAKTGMASSLISVTSAPEHLLS